jgi:demethylmenaquinone methyltransferase/2-methoxy-6-polyprenyl-1,4-benzoquinol methylase
MPENILFDLIAPVYDRLIRAAETEKIVQLLDLPVEGTLLDVGGGTGRIASQLLPYVDRVVLSDLSFSMLREAKSKPIPVVIQASSLFLPFPDDFFDCILVVDAMHHFDDQAGVVTNLFRVLKPGGRLLIEEPDIRKFQAKLILVVEKLLLMKSQIYTPEKLKNLVEANGGSAYIEDDGQFTAWVVAEKSAR